MFLGLDEKVETPAVRGEGDVFVAVA